MTRLAILALAAALASVKPTSVWADHALPDELATNNAALAYWQAFALLPELSKEQKTARRQILDGEKALGADAIAIADASQHALHQLHRGSVIACCVWGPDVAAGLVSALSAPEQVT